MRHELLGDIVVEGLHVGPLLYRGLVEASADDLLQIFGQLAPGIAVPEQPEAVPHVVRDRDVLLDLVELREIDEHHGILLPLDELRLQR